MAALLTVNEVSRRLSITPCTVYRWTRAGRLHAQRVGAKLIRYSEEEVARFLQEQKSPRDGAAA